MASFVFATKKVWLSLFEFDSYYLVHRKIKDSSKKCVEMGQSNIQLQKKRWDNQILVKQNQDKTLIVFFTVFFNKYLLLDQKFWYNVPGLQFKLLG